MEKLKNKTEENLIINFLMKGFAENNFKRYKEYNEFDMEVEVPIESKIINTSNNVMYID